MKQIECSVAIQVLPQVEDSQVIAIVDEVIAYIQSLGLTMAVGPFETTVEGDFYTLMDMVKECQRICITSGAPHVLSYVKIHYSPQNRIWSIDEKTTKHNRLPQKPMNAHENVSESESIFVRLNEFPRKSND